MFHGMMVIIVRWYLAIQGMLWFAKSKSIYRDGFNVSEWAVLQHFWENCLAVIRVRVRQQKGSLKPTSKDVTEAKKLIDPLYFWWYESVSNMMIGDGKARFGIGKIGS
jgi:hypothetical protein